MIGPRHAGGVRGAITTKRPHIPKSTKIAFNSRTKEFWFCETVSCCENLG